MPLFSWTRRSLPFSSGRRRSSSVEDGRSTISRRHTDSELSSKAGQHVTTKKESAGAEGADATLKRLAHVVQFNFEATQASCKAMRAKLREELELQKGLWISSSSCSQSMGYRIASTTSLAPAVANDELSQSQVLVFAAADAGDGKQLAAALSAAKQFSTVSLSLEICCRDLNSSEEAMLTWRCLLDALQAQNRHEIEVWIEEARGLGLEIPASLGDALLALARREAESLEHMQKYKNIEEKLKFALEAADPELLEDVVAEATSIGSKSSLVQQAISQLRAQRQAAMAPPKAIPAKAKTPVGGQWLPRPASPQAQRLPRSQAEHVGNIASQTRESSDSPPPPLFPKVEPETIPNINYCKNDFRENSSSPTTWGPEIQSCASSRSYTSPDEGRSVKDLFEECKRLGIDTRGCTDKSDLLHLIRTAPRSTSTSQKLQQGFVTQIPKAQPLQASSSDSVWNRKFAPPRYITKRSQSLYLLGLDATKSLKQSELRSAYRKCAMECHPDRAQNHSRQEQAKELFQQVKEAFDLLSSQSGFDM